MTGGSPVDNWGQQGQGISEIFGEDTAYRGYVTGLGIALARIEKNSVERTLHLEACEVCGESTRWTRVACIYIHT